MVIKRSTVEKIPRGSLMNNLMSENPDDFFWGERHISYLVESFPNTLNIYQDK